MEERLGRRKKARVLLLKYFAIEENYQQSDEVDKLYKQYNQALNEYLNLNQEGNTTEKEKQKLLNEYNKEISAKHSHLGYFIGIRL